MLPVILDLKGVRAGVAGTGLFLFAAGTMLDDSVDLIRRENSRRDGMVADRGTALGNPVAELGEHRLHLPCTKSA